MVIIFELHGAVLIEVQELYFDKNNYFAVSFSVSNKF